MGHILAQLGKVDAIWLVAAAAGCALAVVGSAGSWRSAMSIGGAELSLPNATARYGAGSLVNTFVPFRVGDAVRIGLFSRCVPHGHRLLKTGGAFAALGVGRALVLGVLVLAGALTGAMPLWPAFIALGVGVVALAAAFRWKDLRMPGAWMIAWIAIAVAGRLAAATAIGYSLGISHPLAAATVVVPALDLAGLVPLTPGNIGIASSAIALALRSEGVSFAHGLAAGIAFHAVDIAVGLAIGTASLLWLGAGRVKVCTGAIRS